MPPLIARALDVYKSAGRMVRKLRGQSEEDLAARRICGGQSWDEFCDTLKAAGAAVSGVGVPGDPLTQAEGYRYLSRLTQAGLQAFLEFNDPDAPVLRRMVDETIKIGADNPDNWYQNASVSGAHRYRLRGRRGTVHFLTFSTQKGGYGESGGLPPTGFLDSQKLEVAEDGSFEIILSVDRPEAANWLPMQPDTGMLIVRQTFLDREHEEPARLTLERLDGNSPAPLSASRVDAGLGRTAAFVAGCSLLFAKWAHDFQAHANELPRFDPDRSTAAGGDPEIAYYHSYWRLGPDQALVIEATPPECEYWNFQLNNHWMESLDYRHYRIHINKHTARYRADGSVQVVVAHRDPGVPNWLTTAGHRHGTMCWRWVRAKDHPQPQTRVVPWQSLRG